MRYLGQLFLAERPPGPVLGPKLCGGGFWQRRFGQPLRWCRTPAARRAKAPILQLYCRKIRSV
jgi:hypothetical protein